MKFSNFSRSTQLEDEQESNLFNDFPPSPCPFPQLLTPHNQTEALLVGQLQSDQVNEHERPQNFLVTYRGSLVVLAPAASSVSQPLGGR
jgi:hypothetical protein